MNWPKILIELLGVAAVILLLLLLVLSQLPGEAEGPPQPFQKVDMTPQEMSEFYYDCKEHGGRVVLVDQNTRMECRPDG